MFFPFALYICYAFEKSKNISNDFMGIFSANPHEMIGPQAYGGVVAFQGRSYRGYVNY